MFSLQRTQLSQREILLTHVIESSRIQVRHCHLGPLHARSMEWTLGEQHLIDLRCRAKLHRADSARIGRNSHRDVCAGETEQKSILIEIEAPRLSQMHLHELSAGLCHVQFPRGQHHPRRAVFGLHEMPQPWWTCWAFSLIWRATRRHSWTCIRRSLLYIGRTERQSVSKASQYSVVSLGAGSATSKCRIRKLPMGRPLRTCSLVLCR